MLVERGPFKHEAKDARWEFSVSRAGANRDGGFMLSVHGMKVRNTLFLEEHADDDTQEARHLGHVSGRTGNRSTRR